MPSRYLHTESASLTVIDRVAVVVVVVAGLVARFAASSPLWLDEALSVEIARLPLADIPDALRMDGHPPLYYVVLHGWMNLFGEGDVAVRALSGCFAVLAIPVVAAAARRRVGPTGWWTTLALGAMTPWWFRYGTETRMYSLVGLLVGLGWLAADDLMRRRSPLRWIALAAVTGALVLSHYWALYLVAAAVVVLLGRLVRSGSLRSRSIGDPGAFRVLGAIAAGSLAFVPWLPVFLDQVAHTGTPWAMPTRPTRAVVELAGGLGGGENFAEGLLFGFGFLLLAVLALVLVGTDRWSFQVDLRTVPGVRREMAVAVLTAGLGIGVSLLTGAVFVARYAAVLVPLLTVAAGVALARLPAPWPRRAAVAGLAAFAAVGGWVTATDTRTQGAEIAAAVAAAHGAGDVVAVCPDQLGPATVRGLEPEVAVVGLPTFARPDRIDWRDYAARNRAAEPAVAVEELLARAGGGSLWFVTRGGYRTYEGYCEAVLGGLQRARPGARVVVPDRGTAVFEPASLILLPPD